MGVFYNYCKLNTQLISKFFFRRLIINGQENIPLNKPVLLALNHPNSFLDAVIVGGHLKRDTHFLARGDAFKNNFARPILHSLNMLPIYRLSEGKENLGKNNDTFDACQNILAQKKMVILFAEGLSENNWDLRPMRKGLARLALKAWNSQTPANELEVIPIGLTYEHYQGEGKVMLINIGKSIKASEFDIQGNEAQFVREFNQKVFNGLASLLPVYPNMKPNSEIHQQFRFQLQQKAAQTNNISNILSSINLQDGQAKAVVKEYKIIQNTLVFLPLYAFARWLAQKLFKQALFHDSVIFGLLLFLWPVYLLLVFGLIRLFM
jgi:1-acyl-sn-glycerol-3-phosphate acyltransferase